jgi:hypothetical protein
MKKGSRSNSRTGTGEVLWSEQQTSFYVVADRHVGTASSRSIGRHVIATEALRLSIRFDAQHE